MQLRLNDDEEPHTAQIEPRRGIEVVEPIYSLDLVVQGHIEGIDHRSQTLADLACDLALCKARESANRRRR